MKTLTIRDFRSYVRKQETQEHSKFLNLNLWLYKNWCSFGRLCGFIISKSTIIDILK